LTIADEIIAQEGNGPSNGEPRFLGLLGASGDVFALDRAIVEILGVEPDRIPTLAAAKELGCSPELEAIAFPRLCPQDLRVSEAEIARPPHPHRFRPAAGDQIHLSTPLYSVD
jgi:uncharacterized protein (DUF362 family)